MKVNFRGVLAHAELHALSVLSYRYASAGGSCVIRSLHREYIYLHPRTELPPVHRVNTRHARRYPSRIAPPRDSEIIHFAGCGELIPPAAPVTVSQRVYAQVCPDIEITAHLKGSSQKV